MATQPEGSLLIGIFDDPERAERALDDLRIAGFDEAHLGLAVPQGGATGEGVATGLMAGGFGALGLPGEAAETYERELRAGHAIVAVQPAGSALTGRPETEEAREILHRNGARLGDGAPA